MCWAKYISLKTIYILGLLIPSSVWLKMKIDLFMLGCYISAVAATLILAELAYLAINGIESISSVISTSILWILFLLAIGAYIAYTNSEIERAWLIKYSVPPGLAIVFIGLILLSLGDFRGAWIVLLGYLVEPIAGVAVMLRALRISRLWGLSIYIGSIAYLAGLPLYIYSQPLIAIIGDIIKLAGFLGILMNRQRPPTPENQENISKYRAHHRSH